MLGHIELKVVCACVLILTNNSIWYVLHKNNSIWYVLHNLSILVSTLAVIQVLKPNNYNYLKRD